MATILKNRH